MHVNFDFRVTSIEIIINPTSIFAVENYDEMLDEELEPIILLCEHTCSLAVKLVRSKGILI